MAQLEVALSAAKAALDTVSEMAPDFVRLHERVTLQLTLLHDFQDPCAEGSVRWVEVGTQLRLVESPLDISRAVQTHMIQRTEPAPTPHDAPYPDGTEAQLEVGLPKLSHRAWIFTSATLGEDEQMRWFTEPCGLSDARKLRVASPFDYELMSAIYVPPGMPKPNRFQPHAIRCQLGAKVRETVGRPHLGFDNHPECHAQHR